MDSYLDLQAFDTHRYEAMTGRPVEGGVHALEPDLLGEYFVLSHLSGQSPAALRTLEAFQRAIGGSPRRATPFLQRTALDFPDHPVLAGLLQASASGDSPGNATQVSVAVLQEHAKRSHFSHRGVEVLDLVKQTMGNHPDANLLSRLHAFTVGAEAARGDNLEEAAENLLGIAECCSFVAQSLASTDVSKALAIVQQGVDRYTPSLFGYGVPVLTF